MSQAGGVAEGEQGQRALWEVCGGAEAWQEPLVVPRQWGAMKWGRSLRTAPLQTCAPLETKRVGGLPGGEEGDALLRRIKAFEG